MPKSRAALILIACILACPAHAEMRDENLLVAMPQGFEIAFQERKGNTLISEMVPAGETVENWTEMVTTHVYFGGLAMTPQAFYDQMRQGSMSSCKGGNGKLVRSGEENGYPFAFGFLTCPLNPATNKREATWIKAIKGKDSFYVVQRATKQSPTTEIIIAFSQYLSGVKVCDSRVPERACPNVQEEE